MASTNFDIKKVNRKDFAVGLVILILLAIAVYFLFKDNKKTTIPVPTPGAQERVEERFGFDIPDDIEKTELTDVSGGTGGGVATRTEILVDLPDPETGKYYQAWLEKDGQLVSLGSLRMAKGGWLVTYSASRYPEYNKVIVSLETRVDSTMETKILEGSFN